MLTLLPPATDGMAYIAPVAAILSHTGRNHGANTQTAVIATFGFCFAMAWMYIMHHHVCPSVQGGPLAGGSCNEPLYATDPITGCNTDSVIEEGSCPKLCSAVSLTLLAVVGRYMSVLWPSLYLAWQFMLVAIALLHGTSLTMPQDTFEDVAQGRPGSRDSL